MNKWLEFTNSFTKQEWDRVLMKGKHLLSCAEHRSCNLETLIPVNVLPTRDQLIVILLVAGPYPFEIPYGSTKHDGDHRI